MYYLIYSYERQNNYVETTTEVHLMFSCRSFCVASYIFSKGIRFW